MAVQVGGEFFGVQQATADARHGRGDVLITISGQMAEDLLGRGAAEARAKEELVRQLLQKLDDIEGAGRQGAAEHERLGQLAQDVHDKLTQVSGEVALQIAPIGNELNGLRGGLVASDRRLEELQQAVERLQGQFESVASELAAARTPKRIPFNLWAASLVLSLTAAAGAAAYLYA